MLLGRNISVTLNQSVLDFMIALVIVTLLLTISTFIAMVLIFPLLLLKTLLKCTPQMTLLTYLRLFQALQNKLTFHISDEIDLHVMSTRILGLPQTAQPQYTLTVPSPLQILVLTTSWPVFQQLLAYTPKRQLYQCGLTISGVYCMQIQSSKALVGTITKPF